MGGMMTIRRVSRALLSPVVWVIIVTFAVGLFYLGGNTFIRPQEDFPMLYKGPSAKVNGVLISDEEFNKVYGPLFQNYGQIYPPEELKEQALKRCINDEIIRQYIKRWHIRTSNQELDRFMQKQIYANYKTPEELETLYNQVGISSKRELVKIVREQLDRKNFFAELARRWKITVPDSEIKARFEELELAHILIATNSGVKKNPLSDAEALKRANEAYQKIKSGTEFATVAKEYSDDPSKDNGGNLGRHTIDSLRQQFDPDFVAAAEKLKVGEVSQPVKTQFGYHLIKLIDRKEAKGPEFNSVKDDLRRDALAEKVFSTRNDQLSKWLQNRVEEARIEIIDPALRAYRLKKDKKFNEAAEAYAKALKLGKYKKDVSIYIAAAETLKEAKRYDEAIKVLKDFPSDRIDQKVQLTLAEVYDAKGDKRTAKSILNREVARAMEDTESLRKISDEMKRLKYDDEAKALDDKIAQIQAKLEKKQAEYEELLKKQQEAEKDKSGLSKNGQSAAEQQKKQTATAEAGAAKTTTATAQNGK